MLIEAWMNKKVKGSSFSTPIVKSFLVVTAT